MLVRLFSALILAQICVAVNVPSVSLSESLPWSTIQRTRLSAPGGDRWESSVKEVQGRVRNVLRLTHHQLITSSSASTPLRMHVMQALQKAQAATAALGRPRPQTRELVETDAPAAQECTESQSRLLNSTETADADLQIHLDSNVSCINFNVDIGNMTVKSIFSTVSLQCVMPIDALYPDYFNPEEVTAVSLPTLYQGRKCVFDGDQKGQLFVVGAVDVTFDGFLFLRGEADRGGAILATTGATVTVSNSIFLLNKATGYSSSTSLKGGGAIYLFRPAVLRCYTCAFIDNEGKNRGGAVVVSNKESTTDQTGDEKCFVMLTRTLMANNTLFESGYGGAIYNKEGDIETLETTLSGNCADSFCYLKGYGGSIYNDDGSISLYNSSLSASKAEKGAAIFSSGEDAVISTTNVSFDYNIAMEGGAVYTTELAETNLLQNTEFFGNQALGLGGGAISNGRSCKLTATGVTFSLNTAVANGGAILNGWSVVTNAKIVDCFFEYNTAGENGGAIENQWGIMEFELCRFQINIAGVDGGAIANQRGEIVVEDCEFESNAAASTGGAISNFNSAHLTLRRSSIRGSVTNKKGGGLHNKLKSEAFIEACNFTFNYAFRDGGAVYNLDGSHLLTLDSRFESNAGEDFGGAVANGLEGLDGTSLSETFVQANNTIFLNNSASKGGGGIYQTLSDNRMPHDLVAEFFGCTIGGEHMPNVVSGGTTYGTQNCGAGVDVSGGRLLFVESRVSHNDAAPESSAQDGGGICVRRAAVVTIVDSVLERNTAQQGGALKVVDYATVTARNSVIANNYAVYAGGAVHLDYYSSFDILNCRFERNDAFTRGGAIDLISTKIAATSSFDLIENENGTASQCSINASNPSDQDACAAVQELTNRILDAVSTIRTRVYLSVNNSVFLQNKALYGGVAALSCGDQSLGFCNVSMEGLQMNDNTNGNQTHGSFIFFLSNMQSLEPLRSLCKDCNGTDSGEAGLATELGLVLMEMINYPGQQYELSNLVSTVEAEWVAADQSVIPDISSASGAIMPYFSIILTDYLRGVIENDDASLVTLVEPEGGFEYPGFLTLTVISRVSDGVALFDRASLQGVPGQNYNINVQVITGPNAATSNKEYNFTSSIKVHLRECTDGEILADGEEGTQTCTLCLASKKEINFRYRKDSQACERCPQNAICFSEFCPYGNYIKQINGLDCGNQMVYQNVTKVVVLDGYWKSSEKSVNILECPNEEACVGLLTYPGLDVNSGSLTKEEVEPTFEWDVDGQCALNYKGRLCMECDDGAGHTSTYTCKKCYKSHGINALIWLAYCIFEIVLVLYTVVTTIQANSVSLDKRPNHSEMIKVIINYLQMISPLQFVNYKWPDEMTNLFTAQESAGSQSATGVFSKECALKGTSDYISPAYLQIIIEILIVPLMLIVQIGFFYYKSKAYRKSLLSENNDVKMLKAQMSIKLSENNDVDVQQELRMDAKEELTKAADDNERENVADRMTSMWLEERIFTTIAVTVFYKWMEIVQFIFAIFTCRAIDPYNWRKQDEYPGYDEFFESVGAYLERDMSVQCWTGGHLACIFLLGLPMLLGFCLGAPLWSAWMLHEHKEELGKPRFYVNYGFLYLGYEPKFYYYESITMLRKLATLSVLVTPVNQWGTPVQVAVLLAVFIVSLMWHLQYKPYYYPTVNILETLSLLTGLITLYFGQLYYTGALSRNMEVLITVLAVLVNFGLLVFFAFSVVYEVISFEISKMDGAVDGVQDGEVSRAELEAHLEKTFPLWLTPLFVSSFRAYEFIFGVAKNVKRLKTYDMTNIRRDLAFSTRKFMLATKSRFDLRDGQSMSVSQLMKESRPSMMIVEHAEDEKLSPSTFPGEPKLDNYTRSEMPKESIWEAGVPSNPGLIQTQEQQRISNIV